MKSGKITKISGPLIVADQVPDVKLYDLVKVGEQQLTGEVIEMRNTQIWVQVYEETSGLQVGEPVVSTGQPLSLQLGPGLLTSIYDGIQRPLEDIADQSGTFIERGIDVPSLPEKKWDVEFAVSKGDEVMGGGTIARVTETSLIEHKVMVPPPISGKVVSVAKDGKYTVDEVVCQVEDRNGETHDIKLAQWWPIRTPRPLQRKLLPDQQLVTGTRVLDTFFPLTKGGTAAIPGPFGAGKTVTQQQIAKWAAADIVVYVGCGERGNEMTDILEEFPELIDPKSGKPLMERTILIANTSNMPIAAREASVYTGITIAEYYRDMGYDVAMMADSTSRWAEAMREMSGRLEEMPGEEGYPAYLNSRIAQFYERAGRVIPLASEDGEELTGSVSVIGAVSPPGGDLSEPVSQSTLQVTKVFWSLERSLAYARHYPAINWLTSYSKYTELVDKQLAKEVDPQFPQLRRKAMQLLKHESELLEIIRIVGSESLSSLDRLVLDTAKMIREDFLQQFAFDEIDTYTSLRKQYLMLQAIIRHHQVCEHVLTTNEGVAFENLADENIRAEIAQMKDKIKEDELKKLEELVRRIPEDIIASVNSGIPEEQRVDITKLINNLE